ncbi:MAG: adenylate/guanylate cyclase domain-containing protein [Actinobacteria bacterium]|nr:adenylate/guanylate cyclase domain-containing protein [Actinomycetota bacterium]
METPAVVRRRPVVLVGALLALPVLTFGLLLSWPSIDGRWAHNPAHLWLILGAAALNAALAYATGVAAERRGDLRVALVSLAFLVCAGFLGLHALATPKVLLDGANAGFVIATPVGLVLAGALAAASSLVPDDGAPTWATRLVPRLRWGILGLVVAWGAVSLTGVPPLGGTGVPARGSPLAVALATVGLALYALALVNYVALLRRRPSAMLLAIVIGQALLAEATLATAVSPTWHATWWGWHVLILAASLIVAVAAHTQWHEERFGDLYLGSTGEGARDLSVLFADLQGFTRFSERNEPREVSRMLNRYFAAAIPALVRRHGGEVDRIIGDALMATFNRLGDRPDHAADALRAAVELQEETGRIAAERPDWPRFRVGVNTGPAIVCVLGVAGGRTYTVIGDTVNVAARLEGLAPPGGVALGPETARRVGTIQTEPLGHVTLKGRDATVEALLLVRMDAPPARTESASGRTRPP